MPLPYGAWELYDVADEINSLCVLDSEVWGCQGFSGVPA